MDGSTVLLLASAVLVVAVVGVWLSVRGWVATGALEARSALDEVEAEAARWRSRLDARLRRTAIGALLQQRIAAAGVALRVLDLAALLVAAAAVAFVLADAILPVWLAVAAAALASRGVLQWLERRRARRGEEFVAQLPELARVLSNATGAGRSLAGALVLAARELDDPARAEIETLAQELRIGQPLERALERLGARLPSRELQVLVSTLLIQQRAGGDLVGALRDLADTLEGRRELAVELRTLMSGSVFTGYLTMALGVGTLLVLNLIEPGVIERMLAGWGGRLAFLVAGGLYAVGLVMIRRTTRIEV